MNDPDPTPPTQVLGYAKPDTHPRPRPLTAVVTAAVGVVAGALGLGMLSVFVVIGVLILQNHPEDSWHGVIMMVQLLIFGILLLMAAASCLRSVPKMLRGRR